MSTPDKIITGALRELAGQATPPRLRIDAAWRAGRRRRLTAIVTSAAGAAAVAVAVPLAVTSGPSGPPAPTFPGSGSVTAPSSHPATRRSPHVTTIPPSAPPAGPPRVLAEPIEFRQVASISPAPCHTGYPFQYGGGPAECIHLTRTGMTLTRITAAQLDTMPSSGYGIAVRMLPGDAREFGTLTGKLARQRSPHNQLAVIVGGVVYSAPAVEQAIPGGVIQIVVHSAAQAHNLERDLGIH